MAQNDRDNTRLLSVVSLHSLRHLDAITVFRRHEIWTDKEKDKRNRANGGVATLCSYEELLVAIWGDEPGHTEPEVNHLVWELRKKLGPGSKESQFLELVRGLGYRLVTHH